MLDLAVAGMTCAHCVRAVTEAVGALPGAGAVEVDLAAGRVRIGGAPDAAAVRRAIEAEGYEVRSAA
jgi:copper chaperone